MPELKLEIQFHPFEAVLVETTKKFMAESIPKIDGPVMVMSNSVEPSILITWTEDEECWHHSFVPTSFEKKGKVFKFQDTEGDQWVFALQE